MVCPHCGKPMSEHGALRDLWRCLNPLCQAFDRWVTRRAAS